MWTFVGLEDARLVKWNNKLLSEQELTEIIETINNLTIKNSYDCSACDPLLFAFCNVFNINIHYIFCDNLILYKVEKPRRIVYLSSYSVSNSHNQNCDGHMEHIKNINQDLMNMSAEQ